MTVYLSIFAFLVVLGLALKSRQTELRIAFVFCIFLALFAGTRTWVGCDYIGYLLRFLNFNRDATFADVLSFREPAFELLNFATIHAGFTYNTLILAASTIYVACLYVFSRLAKSPIAFLALSLPVLVYQLGMSGMRQALALGFIMLAIVAFQQRKRLYVALLIALGSLFHTSAAIFLPLAVIAGRKVSMRNLVISLVVMGPITVWLLGDRVATYNDRYVEQVYGENSSGGAWIRYVLTAIPFMAFLWKRRLIKLREPELYGLYLLFAMIVMAMAPIGLVSTVALHRLTFYAMPVGILVMLSVSASVFSARSGLITRVLPYVYYLVYLVGWFTLSRHADSCYIPYRSWLLM